MTETQEGATAAAVEGAEGAGSFPWPPTPDTSTLEALGRTWSWSVLRPSSFFRALPPRASVAPAAAFHVLCTLAGAGADLFWRMALPTRAPLAAAGTDPLVEFLFAVPLGLVATAFVAMLLHAALFTLGAAHRGMATTLRVLLYTAGPSLFLVIPGAGALIGAVWWIVLAVIGLREAHGATTGRAAAAVALVVFALAVAISMMLLAALVLGLLVR